MYLFAPSENKIIERIIYAMIFLVIAFNCIMVALTDMSVLIEKRISLFILIGIFLSIATVSESYAQKRCKDASYRQLFSRTAFILKRMSEMLLIAFICAIFSYLVTSFNLPMQDEMFNSWDQALGLYWLEWLEFIKVSPIIAEIWCFAYKAALPQIVGCVIILGILGHYKDAQLFVFLFLSVLIITLIISGLFPALAAYYHYNITPDMIKGTSLAAPYAHIEPVLGLRSGEITVIDPDNIKGLVTFPSFHASLGMIFMICLRNVPVINIISYIVNSTMIIATPINGGHYFVDVIGGCIIVMVMYKIYSKIISHDNKNLRLY